MSYDVTEGYSSNQFDLLASRLNLLANVKPENPEAVEKAFQDLREIFQQVQLDNTIGMPMIYLLNRIIEVRDHISKYTMIGIALAKQKEMMSIDV